VRSSPVDVGAGGGAAQERHMLAAMHSRCRVQTISRVLSIHYGVSTQHFSWVRTKRTRSVNGKRKNKQYNESRLNPPHSREYALSTINA